MIYVMSDLHGCYEKYRDMLEKIRFGEADTLYILGDVVDRGSGGIKILQDMMERKNIIPLRGNHDYIAGWLLQMLGQPKDIFAEVAEDFELWLKDGGESTYRAFVKLSSEEQKQMIRFLRGFWDFQELDVGGRSFFMAHTVPKKARMMQPDTLKREDLLFERAEYEKVYFPDRYIVTGHTPTALIDRAYTGRIYMKNNHIAVDCGAVFGLPLGCLCLDTLEAFYVA